MYCVVDMTFHMLKFQNKRNKSLSGAARWLHIPSKNFTLDDFVDLFHNHLQSLLLVTSSHLEHNRLREDHKFEIE